MAMTTTPPIFRKLEKASITLADCLACSGCITSAETILVEAQSAQKLYSVFQVTNTGSLNHILPLPRYLAPRSLHVKPEYQPLILSWLFLLNPAVSDSVGLGRM